MRATYGLILAEIAAYAVLSLYSSAVFSYLGFSVSGFVHGQVWTPLTSMFVHADLFHLAFNLFFLYVFGIPLEQRIGPRKTLAVFLIAGVLSLLVGIPFYSLDTRIVGASIGVSAIVGAVVVLAADKHSPLLLSAPLGLVATIYLIFNAFMLVYDQAGGIAYQSHIIGFSMGVILGLAWRRGEARSIRMLQ